MHKKYKSWVINFSVLMLSILITLIFLEILIRIFSIGAHRRQQMLRKPYDSQAGYQHHKNLDIKVDSGNGETHVITNEYGYIGEWYPCKKPDNEFRIANYGDSFVEGVQMVDWDKTFVNLIEYNLNNKSNTPFDFRSINYGISSRGTIEELRTYKYIAQNSASDLNILWFTVGNDFFNNYFPTTNYPPENKIGKIKYLLQKSALVSFLFEHLKGNISFISFLQKIGILNKPAYTGGDNIKDDGVPFDEKLNFSTESQMNKIQENAYKITSQIIKEFEALTKENNEKFFVVLIPSQLYLSSELQTEFFERYNKADKLNYDFSKPSNKIKNILQENNIDFTDLADPFKQYEDKNLTGVEYCGKLFGDHFTPCGHKVVADILASYIDETYLKR